MISFLEEYDCSEVIQNRPEMISETLVREEI